MSLNEKDLTLSGNKGVDPYPGIANPTACSTHADSLEANLVTDPTTDKFGAGAGPNFEGHRAARRNSGKTGGVIEGAPGLIESTNIDPLNENSNKDDGWANATSTPDAGASGISSTVSGATNTATAMAASAAGVAVGAAQYAYGHAMGDEQTKLAGIEAVWGKQ